MGAIRPHQRDKSEVEGVMEGYFASVCEPKFEPRRGAI